MHIPIDFFRMWLLTKVFKLAFKGKKNSQYVIFLALFQAKFKFVSVLMNFNDVIMQITALIAIYFHLRQNRLLAIVFMGTASAIKMSALLYLPGCLLVQAFEYGIFRGSLVYLIGVFAVQLLWGIEFILANADGYFEMAYDFSRKFDQSESINFHYLSQKMQHSKEFEQFLLSLHLGFLVIFLLFKWTSAKSIPDLFS